MWNKTKQIASKSIHNIKQICLVDIHEPEYWIGINLQSPYQELFQQARSLIDQYIYKSTSLSISQVYLLVDINDLFNLQICCLHDSDSIQILQEIFKYIRIKLLYNSPEYVEYTMILCDFLIKNSFNFKIFLFIGQRKFMKTISIVGRRFEMKQGYKYYHTAALIFDTLQAWGEGFYTRRSIYPHIWETYSKLKNKHHHNFPRPDFDPTRVPIFLEPLRRSEYDITLKYRNNLGYQEESVNSFDYDTDNFTEDIQQNHQYQAVTPDYSSTNRNVNFQYQELDLLTGDAIEFNQSETSSNTHPLMQQSNYDFPFEPPPPVPNQVENSLVVYENQEDFRTRPSISMGMARDSQLSTSQPFDSLSELLVSMKDSMLQDHGEYKVETPVYSYKPSKITIEENTKESSLLKLDTKLVSEDANSSKSNVEIDEPIPTTLKSKETQKLKRSSYIPPSSDSSLEVKYFGHQRVVTKKL